jgi:hypothetical protein
MSHLPETLKRPVGIELPSHDAHRPVAIALG